MASDQRLAQTFAAPSGDPAVTDRWVEMHNLAAIMRHWFGPFPPGMPPNLWDRYPDNYLFIDVESTGKEFGADLITEVGWAVVRNRRVTDYGGQLLNWRDYLLPSDWEWVCQRQLSCNIAMAEKGRRWHITPDRLVAEGVDPFEALNTYADIISDSISHGELIIGHNAWFFDRQMIDSNLHRFCSGRKVPWHANAIFDTGLVERASQMDRLPWQGDTLDKWQRRAAAYPYNTRWNLDEHCVQKYQLDRRFQLDLSRLHQAGFDCVVGHLLFETFRDIGEGRYYDPALGAIR